MVKRLRTFLTSRLPLFYKVHSLYKAVDEPGCPIREYFLNLAAMLDTQFARLVAMVLFSALTLVAGLYLVANYNRLFRNQIRNQFLRRNLTVWLIAVCFVFSITPTSQEFYQSLSAKKVLHYFFIQVLAVTAMVLFVFNITWYVAELAWLKRQTFKKGMGIILFTIIFCTVVMGIPINYVANKGSFKNIEYTILFNFWTGCITGLIYITMSYVDLERKRKMNEKELEVSKLRELKTKAELDALHSKINPHFLYNALNSIADLSITDGRKARKMTIALADLFRYSINYSDHNYSTIKEELEMAEVYLLIEKIRFEDQLNYSIQAAGDLNHYLVPRFVLQPIVENAVKHGLKATGKMTEINIEVKKYDDGFQITIADNGPAFPDELTPGYGVKSIYDKMDLLFPDSYEIHFINQPRKQVSIHIHKLMKNEPVV
ncbi:MAG TPA: histidine kinase [Chitinophagaceae bacterium]|nr:histidine kinase [Chitinophagaceae bacterium]